eukprot:11492981-Prorocentrum_lima.AAC.1
MWWSVLGVVLFSGFIVVDTQMIMDRLPYDEYLTGAVELYLDIVNLFICILRILEAMTSSRS